MENSVEGREREEHERQTGSRPEKGLNDFEMVFGESFS